MKLHLKDITGPTVVLAAVFCFVGALASEAAAQQFTFGKKKYVAESGATLEMKIYAEDFPEDVAGLNYTVRISAEDNDLFRLSEATSFSSYASPTYSYADHRMSRNGVVTGNIIGQVVELRGVLYATTEPVAGLPFKNRTSFATVQIPINIVGSGRILVELVSAIDDGVSLLGGSTVEGDEVVPPGEDTPFGDLATVVVMRGDEPFVTDFTDAHNYDGWIFEAGLPSNGDPTPVGASIPGKGFTISAPLDASFGFWGWDYFNRGAWRSPPAGSLLVADWSLASDATGSAVPPFRLRTMTDNNTMSHEVLLQDRPEVESSYSMMPPPAGRTYRTITRVPDFAADNFHDDGMNQFLDLVQFNHIELGNTLIMEKLVEHYVNPANLKNPELIYAQTFDTNVNGGWIIDNGISGGKAVSYSRGRYGLGIESGGPYEVVDGLEKFSLGVWYTPPGMMDVEFDSNKWCKVEAEFYGTAVDPNWNPALRFRVFPYTYEYFAMQLFTPFLDPSDYQMPRPDMDGFKLELWFQSPPELDGVPLNMAFDMIHYHALPEAEDATPTLFLKWVTLTTYDAPNLIEPSAG